MTAEGRGLVVAGIIIIIITIIITIIIIIIIIIILLCTNMQRSLCSSDTRAVITQFEVCK